MRHFIGVLVLASMILLGFVLGVIASSDVIEIAERETLAERSRCLDLLEDNNRKWKKVLIDDAVENE